MRIDYQAFIGQLPRISTELLPPAAAVQATNCKLWTGEVQPIKNYKQNFALTKPGTIKTIYLFGGLYWFHDTADVDYVRGPVSGNTTNRTYFTGNGAPKVTDNTLALTGGGTNYPISYYTLGVPAPTSAPSAVAAGATCNPGDEETIAYVYTYVTGWGEESIPSPPSANLTRCPGDTVTVTGMGVAAPAGNYNITKKRIYRIQQNQTGSDWQFVDEVNITDATYVDTVADADLNEILTSTYYDVPPTDMAGLTIGPYGVMAGFTSNSVCFSEPWIFHAWPADYQLQTTYAIVAIGAIADSWIVLTEERPYLIGGQIPSQYSIRRLETDQACVSKRSVVNFGDILAYASPDGVTIIDAAGNASIATSGLFTRDEWQALKPTSMMAVRWEKYYLCFYDTGTTTGGFYLDPKNPEFVAYTNIYPLAKHNDLVSDLVYLNVGGNVVEWDNNTTYLTYTYRPKPVVTVTPIRLAGAKVWASSYPVTFNMYVDGTLQYTYSVPDAKPFRFPSGFKGRTWQPEITGTANVKRISMASTIGELNDG